MGHGILAVDGGEHVLGDLDALSQSDDLAGADADHAGGVVQRQVDVVDVDEYGDAPSPD